MLVENPELTLSPYHFFLDARFEACTSLMRAGTRRIYEEDIQGTQLLSMPFHVKDPPIVPTSVSILPRIALSTTFIVFMAGGFSPIAHAVVGPTSLHEENMQQTLPPTKTLLPH